MRETRCLHGIPHSPITIPLLNPPPPHFQPGIRPIVTQLDGGSLPPYTRGITISGWRFLSRTIMTLKIYLLKAYTKNATRTKPNSQYIYTVSLTTNKVFESHDSSPQKKKKKTVILKLSISRKKVEHFVMVSANVLVPFLWRWRIMSATFKKPICKVENPIRVFSIRINLGLY